VGRVQGGESPLLAQKAREKWGTRCSRIGQNGQSLQPD
jgi:hypothetical protein